ncbi:uncharacterized protein METZ01_LOCUS239673, partial [marine metagenome]
DGGGPSTSPGAPAWCSTPRLRRPPSRRPTSSISRVKRPSCSRPTPWSSPEGSGPTAPWPTPSRPKDTRCTWSATLPRSGTSRVRCAAAIGWVPPS